MRPTRISGADPEPLGAPPDWNEATDGHCTALFVRRDKVGSLAVMRSAWEVEIGEAVRLYAGARLELGVSGRRHPLVTLAVGDLPDDFEPVVHARRYTDEHGVAMVRVEMLFAHGGGRRSYINLPVIDSFGATVAKGVDACEGRARREGWIE